MFSLTTFGGISLSLDGIPLRGRSTQRRRLAVLTILAVARDYAVSRDKLLAYLWPDLDSEHGRQALSQALSAIRHELGEDVFLAGIDDLRLNPAAGRTDVADFETAIATKDWQTAVACYSGPFLDGFSLSASPEFEAWVDGERRRLGALYGGALEALAGAATSDGDSNAAVAWWRKRAAQSPLDSRVALRLMEALVAAGDRAGAIQHARIHTTMLEVELELSADPSIPAYVERLRHEPGLESRAAVATSALSAAAVPVETGDSQHASTAAVLPTERTPRRFRGLLALGAIAAVVLVAITLLLRDRAVPPALRSLVMGAFQGQDAELSLAVREALRAELDAAPSILVVRDARVAETVRLMGLPDSTPIMGPVATEIAQRRGAPLAVEGSVIPIGNGILIVAKLIESASGAVVASVSERPATADMVIPAITRLARTLRARVVAAVVDTMSGAMPPLTTSSLSALRNYVLARQALARFDREAGIVLLEGALAHDSLFALAHYLLGDMLWYVDRQRESEHHLARALALSDRLPPRERLVVRARYEQVAMDRLDSSLVYWHRAQAAHPEDALGYEGSTWTLRAMGRFAEAAAAADTALRLDPASGTPMHWARLLGTLGAGDTTLALTMAGTGALPRPEAELTAQSWAAFVRRDWAGALAIYDADDPPSAAGLPRPENAYRRQVPLLAMGRFGEAARLLAVVLEQSSVQKAIRALILQAAAETGLGGSRERASVYVRRALHTLGQADFSPPTNARLAERIADIAGRLGDVHTVLAARDLVRQRDRARNLPSYGLALRTIDAAAAFARGDRRMAARLAEGAREGSFFVRSMATVALLEADARLAIGEERRADSLYRAVLTPRSFSDGDLEAMAVLQAIALRRLETRRGGPVARR